MLMKSASCLQRCVREEGREVETRLKVEVPSRVLFLEIAFCRFVSSMAAHAFLYVQTRSFAQVFVWILLESLLASGSAEVVGLSLMCRLVFCCILVNVHFAHRILRHKLTPFTQRLAFFNEGFMPFSGFFCIHQILKVCVQIPRGYY